MPDDLVLEKEAWLPGREDSLYVWALLLVAGGRRGQRRCGHRAQSVLLRATPASVHFPYRWIGDAGLTYIDVDDPAGRTTRYAWSEIARVDTSDGATISVALFFTSSAPACAAYP